MIKMMIAAPHSGSGKTAFASGMLALLKRKYEKVAAFKCGPDYIDTMFHRAALGVESINLDLFLAGEDRAVEIFSRYGDGAEAVLVEGVMGFYDGLGGVTDSASSYEVSKLLDLPVVLVLRARGASLSLAAEIKGFCEFRKPSNIAGAILNECSPMLFKTLAPALEKETGIPILGCLPSMEEAKFESRHLGLYTAGEVEDLKAKISAIADAIEENVDLERLLSLCEGRRKAVSLTPPPLSGAPPLTRCTGILRIAGEAVTRSLDSGRCAPFARDDRAEGGPARDVNRPVISTERSEWRDLQHEQSIPLTPQERPYTFPSVSEGSLHGQKKDIRPIIAVAKDEAFCFLYRETLDSLEDAGAELKYFSPLRDRKLPEGTGGLYIPGGYPELYAKELSGNEALRGEIRRAVLSGLPTVAECGGFMYLGGRMEGSDGKMYEMCGALLGEVKNTGKLVRFGYANLKAKEDSMLFRKGESYPIHEFHYWDSTENGRDLTSEKPLTGRSYECCFASDTLYAGYPHLYMAGKPELAVRFVEKVRKMNNKKRDARL